MHVTCVIRSKSLTRLVLITPCLPERNQVLLCLCLCNYVVCVCGGGGGGGTCSQLEHAEERRVGGKGGKLAFTYMYISVFVDLCQCYISVTACNY